METPYKHKEYLELIAQEISKRLPDNHGFILLAVPYSGNGNERTINYVSNCQREDALRLLDRFMVKMGGNGINIPEVLDTIIELIDEGVGASRKVLQETGSGSQTASALIKTCGAVRQSIQLFKDAIK